MSEPFFIVGPTSVGKTEIAVEAAAICRAEIVGADAFQVYAGLEQLTAKPSEEDMARVPHHLIGHVPRSETYNVARYQQEATACLRDAAARARPVLVVGGSGLYIKALTHGLSPLPPAQPDLRAELESTELPDLVARLRTLDPAAAAVIDLLNKRRVVRAVEVCLATGGRFSAQRITWDKERTPVRGIFLVRDRDDLAARIDRRTNDVLSEDALEETRAALRTPMSETASRIIGLRETGSFLAGEITRAECLDRVRTATRRYAKRQMTWFRGESFESVVDLSATGDVQTLATVIAGKINDACSSPRSVGDKPPET